jgi:hypothetical protein
MAGTWNGRDVECGMRYAEFGIWNAEFGFPLFSMAVAEVF